MAAIERNLSRTSTIADGVRINQAGLPTDVLREAIANAVVHREYHSFFLGQSVTVDMYPDRIEVTNPGGLWGGKTIATLDDGVSRCRNARLMKIMRSLPPSTDTGIRVEGQGSGIAMMKPALKEQGLPRPRFKAGADYFKVVFTRKNAGTELAVDQLRAGSISSDDRIREALSPTQPRSTQELAAATGMKLDTVRSVLRRLISDGSVAATAPSTSRKRKYILVL